MKMKDYFKIINKKIECYNKKAQNPFLSQNIKYNPFKSAFNNTYIWIDNQNNSKK